MVVLDALVELKFLNEDTSEKYLIDNIETMEQRLEEQKKMNNVKDIRETISHLIQVADLLEVADKASEQFYVNTKIKDMTVKFQKLIGEIRAELSVFRMQSHHAVKKHVTAAAFLFATEDELSEEEKYEMLPDAIADIKSCIQIAEHLSKRAEYLSGEARNLQEDSRKALVEANDQDVKNADEKKKLEKALRDEGARKKKYEVLARELKLEVEKYTKDEEAAVAQAQNDKDQAFTLQMVGLITNAAGSAIASINPMSAMANASKPPPNDEGNKPGKENTNQVAAAEQKKNEEEEKKKGLETEVKELEKKIDQAEIDQASKETIAELKKKKEAKEQSVKDIAANIKGFERKVDQLAGQAADNAAASAANARRIADIRMQKRQLEIENAAALAETAEMLSNTKIEVGEIETAIVMIKTVITCLGRITSALDATANFWYEQAAKCKLLQGLGETVKDKLEQFEAKHLKFIKGQVIVALRESGYTWLSLWHMNYYALMEIEKPYNMVKSIVNNMGIGMSPDLLARKSKAVGETLRNDALAEIKDAKKDMV